jgi:CHAT domain-containing protein
VFSAYKLGDYDLMLRRMELTKARASLRQMLQRAPDPDPATLEMEIRQVNAELDRADNETAPVLRERRRTLWDLLAIRRAEANRQQLPSEFSLRAVQEALEPDEAIVYYYWLQPGVLLVVTLDREQIEVTRQLLDNEYTGLVELIDHLGKMTRPVPYMKMIDAYARHLLPEPVQSMLRGKKHVIFSPHRILHLFPFHALRWEGDYLITRLVVSYAPNLTSLLVRYPPSDTATVLAVGAEHFAVPGHSLQPLPGAVREIDDLHVLYTERGVQIKMLREAAASYRRLREWADDGQLSSFRVLHFATHGEDVLGDEPMETYLCLHDGLLDGLEIAGWHLNAELVVLSACHSGKRPFKGRGMNELPGDEMFGLQAAFFSAGVRRVVGALWPADDTAAPVVMAAFHRQLAAGLQPEFALQAAVTAYVQNVRKDSLKNPYYWAPFFISSIGRVQISNAAHEH